MNVDWKKTIYRMNISTLALYLIVYSIYTFIVWDFRNPIEWIVNIPTYSQETRGSILFSWCMYYLFSGMVCAAEKVSPEGKVQS